MIKNLGTGCLLLQGVRSLMSGLPSWLQGSCHSSRHAAYIQERGREVVTSIREQQFSQVPLYPQQTFPLSLLSEFDHMTTLASKEVGTESMGGWK